MTEKVYLGHVKSTALLIAETSRYLDSSSSSYDLSSITSQSANERSPNLSTMLLNS